MEGAVDFLSFLSLVWEDWPQNAAQATASPYRYQGQGSRLSRSQAAYAATQAHGSAAHACHLHTDEKSPTPITPTPTFN